MQVRRLVGLRLAVLAASLAVSIRAEAGTIGFRIDAKVTTGPGVDVEVTLTHTGDEAATDVTVRAELLDASRAGQTVAKVLPNQSPVWNFHLFDQAPAGVFVAVIRATYKDANGYAFEVLSTSPVTPTGKADARVTGGIQPPQLTVGGTGTAKLTLRKPSGRDGPFEAHIVGPGGLEISPTKIPITFDEAGKATADFRIRNTKLLAGTTVNVFALVTAPGAAGPQTDTIRGTVRITAAAPHWTYRSFYQAAAAAGGLLVLLEILALLRRNDD